MYQLLAEIRNVGTYLQTVWRHVSEDRDHSKQTNVPKFGTSIIINWVVFERGMKCVMTHYRCLDLHFSSVICLFPPIPDGCDFQIRDSGYVLSRLCFIAVLFA
jgi:hypothetical protein